MSPGNILPTNMFISSCNKNDSDCYNLTKTKVFNTFFPDKNSSMLSSLADQSDCTPFYNNTDSIAQLDGAGDLSPLPSPYIGQIKNGRSFSVPNETASIRLAPYKLNQKKQVNKLRQDALLSDFDISVSPTEQSVSFLCSTGFYSLVAIPAFSHINVGFRHQVLNITLYCYDITGKIDDVGASVNAVIFFRLSSSDKSSIGGVTVHLHHTVRKVQVQGSSMVNGRTRASVWFVENFLLEKFNSV